MTRACSGPWLMQWLVSRLQALRPGHDENLVGRYLPEWDQAVRRGLRTTRREHRVPAQHGERRLELPVALLRVGIQSQRVHDLVGEEIVEVIADRTAKVFQLSRLLAGQWNLNGF